MVRETSFFLPNHQLYLNRHNSRVLYLNEYSFGIEDWIAFRMSPNWKPAPPESYVQSFEKNG
jgi:hypothetical protein